ncbi:hypothetical protein GCM10007415_45160 [Parapedobacter pyrenivorans]|uniref:SD-repeat containing protein B domain-containing protein n=1 Tax=Parapedobacter pyrenivorans TaxID=1305674 RepID=A0A917I2Y1_9SPHI|nr:carboxypeptidase-like regulatory domain-containing protein [Parapedobacter pyrenivorans]GGH03954.1 hypothetical protein GCM10007415_45160 [Parapedobacter pyrenivorans]
MVGAISRFWIPLFALTLLICPTSMYGQVGYGVTYRFESDTVAVKAGETFSNRLWIHNHTNATVALASNGGDSVSALIGLPSTLTIDAGDRRSFPVKYFADARTFRSHMQRFPVALRAAEPHVTVQPQAAFYGKLEDEGTLRLDTEQPIYYFDQGADQLQLMLICANTGIVPVQFRLQITDLPAGFELIGEKLTISLPPRGVRQIPFTIRKQRNGRQRLDFRLTIRGVDDAGNILAAISTQVQTLSSVGNFMNTAPFGAVPNNAASLRLLNINGFHTIYQLHSNGKLPVHDGRELQYQVNLDYYKQLQGFNLYDTYIDYTTNRIGVKLGNIYENIDYPMSGRGGKISYFPGEGKELSVYALQNNYMLASQVYQGIPGENILAANYTFNRDELPARVTYLYSRHGYHALESQQFSAQLPIRLETDQRLVFEAGYSRERFDDAAHAEDAAAFGMDYVYSGEGIDVTSSHYISTPYYTGMRRGILQSDTRVARTDGDRQLAARVSLLDNQPKFQGRWYDGFTPFRNSLFIGELGYGKRIGGWHVEIKPYFLGQQLSGIRLPQHADQGSRWTSASLRSQVNVNYTTPIHSVYVQADYGYTYRNTVAIPARAFHSVRMSWNYTSPVVGVIGFMQVNPYYLSDVYSIVPGASYTLVSIGPNKRFTVFNGKLTGQLSATYNYYGFSRNHTYAATGNLRWNFGNHWALAADGFYTLSHLRAAGASPGRGAPSAFYDTRQLRVGIEKQFAGMSGRRERRLRLFYYEDLNSNGVHDANEAPVPGVRVTIADKSVYTDKDGKAEFRRMPQDGYRIDHVVAAGGRYAAPVTIMLDKNMALEIPLMKMETVKGQLIAVGQRYATTAPNLSGIRIQAVNGEGKQYEALTDASGHYMLFLPHGTYQLSVASDELPLAIENNRQQLDITAQQVPYTVDFRYRDERKRVHIRRF